MDKLTSFFNYEDIGKKIKRLAKWIFAIEAISTIIGTIVGIIYVIILAIDGMAEAIYIIPFAPLVLVIAIIVEYVATWPIYAFGELVDKTCDLAGSTRGEEIKSKTQAKIDSERIAKLERLRSQGLITEEEYQTALNKN